MHRERAAIAPGLLRRCVKWLHLASEENCFNICDQFEEDSSKIVREMLGAAIEVIEGIREAFSAGSHEVDSSCPEGHPYIVLTETGSDTETAHRERSPSDLFIGCNCDRIRDIVRGFRLRKLDFVEKKREQFNLQQLLEKAKTRRSNNTALYDDLLAQGINMRRNSCSGNHVSLPITMAMDLDVDSDFIQIATQHEHITALKVTTRLWDGREVIRSIGTTFSSGRCVEHGGTGDLLNTHDIRLSPGEHVVDLVFHAGWMVDSITVEVGKLRGSELEHKKIGPFGGDGGDSKETRYPSCYPFDVILVGFKGKLTMTQGQHGVTHLSPIWRSMKARQFE